MVPSSAGARWPKALSPIDEDIANAGPDLRCFTAGTARNPLALHESSGLSDCATWNTVDSYSLATYYTTDAACIHRRHTPHLKVREIPGQHVEAAKH